ncbi:zinc-dependent metalloprotease [Parvicella tangerina]|uniref:Peptidase n=1 Tax=Parvicella tangerina TaxID=2829795 RepID=A0A916NIS3_9FLAO|nr:zinc-dependent metalloprotease [Parvicella tangerina]CAG5084763.1 hypothetical protein CRYO30217_02559 [Parvicella tangerina]
MKILKLLLMAVLLIGTMNNCRKENGVFDIKPEHFLASDKYNSLKLELVAVEGFEPHPEAIDNLVSFLENRLNKPEGIEFVQKTISSPENNSFTPEDLRDLEKDIRSEYAHKDDLTAFIFYADRGYHTDSQNAKTLGVAYSSTSMCIFKNTVDENSGGLTQVSEVELESAVLIHEFSHILGLVNNGTPMHQDHEDPSNPGHCDNENCLMYYSSSTSELLPILQNNSFPTLDNQCLTDLRQSGGK